MIIRPCAESDLGRVLPLIVPDPAAPLTLKAFEARLAGREYRPEHTWIAEEAPGAAPLAAAVWWSGPDDDGPRALDGVYVPDGAPGGRVEPAAALLTAAHAAYAAAGVAEPPEFHIFLPDDWRERPETGAALDWRLEAARRAGLPAVLERLRYLWTPHSGVPAPARRLRFRPEPDDEVFVGLFRRVLTDTLDGHSRKEAARLGAEAQAREDVAFYRDMMSGERSWWRVAETPDGEPVGFAVPSRNPSSPVVGYLGVLPEWRGRGFADDLLGEITRVLVADAGAERIHADTDLGNTPMAAAFDRMGYRHYGRRLVVSAS